MASLGEATNPMPLEKEASRSAAQAPTGTEQWSPTALQNRRNIYSNLSLLVQFTFLANQLVQTRYKRLGKLVATKHDSLINKESNELCHTVL